MNGRRKSGPVEEQCRTTPSATRTSTRRPPTTSGSSPTTSSASPSPAPTMRRSVVSWFSFLCLFPFLSFVSPSSGMCTFYWNNVSGETRCVLIVKLSRALVFVELSPGEIEISAVKLLCNLEKTIKVGMRLLWGLTSIPGSMRASSQIPTVGIFAC